MHDDRDHKSLFHPSQPNVEEFPGKARNNIYRYAYNAPDLLYFCWVKRAKKVRTVPQKAQRGKNIYIFPTQEQQHLDHWIL